MACPHVSGVAGLVLSQMGGIGFTPALLRERLVQTTDNIDAANSFDFIYSQIKNLRRKLKEYDANVELKAVYGIGYKLSEL